MTILAGDFSVTPLGRIFKERTPYDIIMPYSCRPISLIFSWRQVQVEIHKPASHTCVLPSQEGNYTRWHKTFESRMFRRSAAIL
jgi:hypothetical protein